MRAVRAGIAASLVALLGAPVHAGSPPASVSSADTSGGTRVVMLGTGNPNADPERSGPAVAVIAGGRAYLVDCGPGIVRRAAAAAARGIRALEANRLSIVFVTHLHSDHTVGLPDLMLTPWVLERSVPLEVYGPPGIKDMTDHLLAAYAEDIRIRQSGLEPEKSEGYRVNAHEIAEGVVYSDSNVTVTAIAVPHANWEHAFGYRFEARDRVVVISGDTRPTEAIARACNGCDVLVHEVYSVKGFKSRPSVWQRYHADAHTSTEQLAGIATWARPKLLVLYHQLFWGVTDEDLVREVRKGYSGAVVSARDLDVYPLPVENAHPKKR
jgi:ribonuclease BN (tRNA processing enzyme)